jgi:hypothetical protein
MKLSGTKKDPVIVRVIWDDSDTQNKGWAYQVYDGSPYMRRSDWVLTSSGPIIGNNQMPSRQRALLSARIRGNRYVTVVWDV